MRERLDRRWGQFTREEVQQIADRTPFEQYSKSGLSDGDYMPAFTNALQERTSASDWITGTDIDTGFMKGRR